MSDPNRKAERAARQAAAEAAYQESLVGLPPFQSFGKIPRLNREVVITEKIDGTNAAIGVVPETYECAGPGGGSETVPTGHFRVYAQSRTRIITPENDNYGFAAWVQKHADVLTKTLGPGLHFGEWWGVGINRGYGLTERRFSLFNTARWASEEGMMALTLAHAAGVAIYSTPVLYEGTWTRYGQDFTPHDVMTDLRLFGSRAAPGFMNPEGIVVYHKAGSLLFKATCEGDEKPKGQVAPPA